MQSPALRRQGHLLALFTILVWGTTFISSTVLLRDFSPAEIICGRLILAIAALFAARPRRLRLQRRAHEWYFAAAGLCGVTLYFMLENVALTYTSSANCSVIISSAPFFVAIAMRLFFKGQRLRWNFCAGFAIAMLGIGLLSFSGRELRLNPLGDLLCLLAAVSWAFYSVILSKLERFHYDTLMVTRRVFCYGLLFMLPILLLTGAQPSLGKLLKPVNLLNFLYLGLCASALCFVTWNVALRRIGAVSASAYIYLSPVVTILAAWLILGDVILPAALVGAGLTLVGLMLSQMRRRTK